MLSKIFDVSSIPYVLARLQKRARLSAIRNSRIDKTSKVESACQVVNVKMARHSFCGSDCYLLNVDVGPFCSIADQVCIGGAAHPMHFVSTSPVFLSHRDSVPTKLARHEFEYFPTTHIGSDVWIGFGARIRAGIKIGHGAVVGMGAVVTRDVEPYSVVAGNPARVISWRFTPEIRNALLRSQWWELKDEELATVGDLFNSPEEFLKSRGDL